eukprot:TRINITY_DN2307_c0_g1_i2.p1 TRINITY_DN2307_c0_g1~~TRINITY_DN2307_c0_g1_i2.p1  ORF type:complete len:230 (-),score=46.53 TRINITY_DN2307_c0_g1_i2:219-872(-)
MMQPTMTGSVSRTVRRLRALPLLLAAVALCLGLAPRLFVTPEGAPNRRAIVSAGLLGVALAPSDAQASYGSIGGEITGPFERNPKEAVIVGDLTAPETAKAIAEVKKFQKQAEDALAALEKDPQADVMSIVTPTDLGEIRLATNVINNLMDDRTAAGTQRLQRLMNEARFLFEDDAPMPVNRAGEVKPRGPQRLNRIQINLGDYVKYSKQLLEFVEQ